MPLTVRLKWHDRGPHACLQCEMTNDVPVHDPQAFARTCLGVLNEALLQTRLVGARALSARRGFHDMFSCMDNTMLRLGPPF